MTTKVFLIGLCFMTLNLLSQNTFIATVDKTNYKQDEVIKVEFILEGNSNNLNVSNIEMPSFDDFILQGQSQAQSISINNGNMEKKISMQVYLLPKRSGQLKINKARIKVDNKYLETKEIELNIKKSSKPSYEEPTPAKPKKEEEKGGVFI